MKKEYTKPEIVTNVFSADETVAACGELDINKPIDVVSDDGYTANVFTCDACGTKIDKSNICDGKINWEHQDGQSGYGQDSKNNRDGKSGQGSIGGCHCSCSIANVVTAS